MKKAFSFMLVLATLFLCACDNSLLPDDDDPVLEEMDEYIGDADVLIDYAAVEYIDTKSKKVMVFIKISELAAPFQYAETAEAAIEATKTAIKKKNKKLDSMIINYAAKFDGGHIRWTTKDYKTGEIESEWQHLIPNGECTFEKIKSIFNEENQNNISAPVPTTEPQATIDPAKQKRNEDIEYIKQQLLDVDTNKKYDISVSYSNESIDKIQILIKTTIIIFNKNTLHRLSTYIDALKNALTYTERSLEKFEFAVTNTFTIENNIIEKMNWLSTDLKNGLLYVEIRGFDSPIEQNCSLDDFINFKVEKFTIASDEPTDSPTS